MFIALINIAFEYLYKFLQPLVSPNRNIDKRKHIENKISLRAVLQHFKHFLDNLVFFQDRFIKRSHEKSTSEIRETLTR